MKYSPAPWKEFRNEKINFIIIKDATDIIISYDVEKYDNAKLMAAAPELYECLMELIEPDNPITEMAARKKATALLMRLEEGK